VRAGAAADLREALSKLLSEHAFLAAAAMQKGYDGAPDFPAAAAQLDQNSLALAAAISSVYGEAAGQQFLVQWREHIRMFVDFTVGTATKDEAKRRQALAELAAYRTSFAAFLNTANPFLPQEAAAGLLQEHIGQLSTALDSYVQGNYAQTYRLISESHSHMFMTGTGLAGAIVKQFPDRFIPSGM
jgi:exonuclease V gamma subunit